jgi:hypothetical protein
VRPSSASFRSQRAIRFQLAMVWSTNPINSYRAQLISDALRVSEPDWVPLSLTPRGHADAHRAKSRGRTCGGDPAVN